MSKIDAPDRSQQEPFKPMPSFPGFDRLFLLEDPLSNSTFRGAFDASADPLELTRGDQRTDIASSFPSVLSYFVW